MIFSLFNQLHFTALKLELNTFSASIFHVIKTMDYTKLCVCDHYQKHLCVKKNNCAVAFALQQSHSSKIVDVNTGV